MLKKLGSHFYAKGHEGPDIQIDFGLGPYRLDKALKHDFFAATALYEKADPQSPGPRKVVAKWGRSQWFTILPTAWLGWFTSHHEYVNLKKLKGVPHVPQVISRLGKTGFVYEYIPGVSLADKPEISDDFFDKLGEIIDEIHSRRLVYYDLNKRGNILKGDDGLPYLIDFQIAVCYPKRFLLFRTPTDKMLRFLQKADHYHLIKHKRKLKEHTMTETDWQVYRDKMGGLIHAHRAIAGPYKFVRRSMLRFLYRKGVIGRQENTVYNSETDPDRYKNKN